ncbi:crossover junction endonuclease EME1-like [Ostrinia furnacalis]|uniref:crossover junction endonuclease EME1-like n=1 Tax=Ostrinia furnacalis TaxID=93504 RepID=UPI0010390A0E|nr:crossover junction endonuclease EME1-like [Ostrinia furnacalis]
MAKKVDHMDLTQDDSIPLDDDEGLTAVNMPGTSRAQKTRGRGKRRSVGSMENTENKKTKASKQSLKEKQAAEKLAKKAANEMNKIYKPGECMKHMNIEIHPTLAAEWYMANVQTEAAAAGARIVPAPDLFHPGLVVWTRTVPPTLCDTGGNLALSSNKEACARALYVITADDIHEHVSGKTLSRHVGQLREMVDRELTLVVFGAKDFFKKSGRQTVNSRKMTELELEMAITDLLVTASCDTVMVETPSELALLIVQFTKAIAEAPHKNAKKSWDEQAEFYMRGDKKNSVTVDKDGNGLARLWQQIIAVLPNSSLETSRSLCEEFKSPLALYEVSE